MRSHTLTAVSACLASALLSTALSAQQAATPPKANTEKLMLSFALGGTSIKFNNVSIDGFELDATSTRLMLGVTWRPMMGRR